jgi:hypothetical protein
MKLKLSMLLFSTAVFCQEPKTKWVKDDIKCGRFTGVSCTEEEINAAQAIQSEIDKLVQQLQKLNLKIKNLEATKKCRLVHIGTQDAREIDPTGQWVVFDQDTCKTTSKPCPNTESPELEDGCIFSLGGAMGALDERQFMIEFFKSILSKDVTVEERELLQTAISQLEAGNELSPEIASKLMFSSTDADTSDSEDASTIQADADYEQNLNDQDLLNS